MSVYDDGFADRGTITNFASPPVIVAEVSKTYVHSPDSVYMRERVEEPMGTIGKRFEHVVAVNEARGYRLRDWKMTSIVFQVNSIPLITETIVAVFEMHEMKPEEEA